MTKQPEDPGDTHRGGFDSGRSIALQWVGLLAAPSAWLLNLQFSYPLAHAACHGSGMVPLHLATIAALLLSAGGGAIAFFDWRRAGSNWPGDAVGPVERVRLMSTVGLGATAFFIILIVAQWIPAFMFNPCLLT